jgi:hypothetical protein
MKMDIRIGKGNARTGPLLTVTREIAISQIWREYRRSDGMEVASHQQETCCQAVGIAVNVLPLSPGRVLQECVYIPVAKQWV